MPAPSIVHDWRFNVSQSISGVDSATFRQTLLLALINSLLGLGSWTDDEGAASSVSTPWEHVQSCDSTAVSTSTNLCTAASDFVWAAEGVAHSHIILRSPNFFGAGNPLYMLLNCGPAGTVNATLGVVFSRVGFTGGTTTARPTAVDEHIARPIAGTITTAGWQGDDNSSGLSVACRLHVLMTDDARKFHIFITRASLCIAYWGLFDGESDFGITEPYLFNVTSIDFVAGSEAEVLTAGNLDDNAVRLWLGRDQGGVGDFTCEPEFPYSGSTGTVAHSAQPLNGFNGGWLPMPFCLVGIAPAAGPIAVIPDVWMARAAAGTGSPGEDLDSGLDQFMQFGIFMVPWNDSTIVLG